MNREKMKNNDDQARQQLLNAIGAAGAVAPVLDFDTPFQESVHLGRPCRGCFIEASERIELLEQNDRPEGGKVTQKNKGQMSARKIPASDKQGRHPEVETEQRRYDHAA